MTRLTLAALLLAGCVPTVARQDCVDGAIWRENCDRPRYTRTIVDDSCMRGCKPPRPEPEPEPEPEEPGGHWATRDNEPDSRTDTDAHRDWQRDRDQQREDGTW
jgi:hypothetical protein